MAQHDKQGLKETSELQAQLRHKVVEILSERQNDVTYIRMLNGPQSAWDGACDDVFDAIENALVHTVRNGKPLAEGDDAYEAIGDMAWAIVTFLEDTAHSRMQLEEVLSDKCEELVIGSERRRWKNRRRASAHNRI